MSDQPAKNETLKSYVIGLILCVALTLLAYFCVANKPLVIALGLVQTALQLVLFLHVGQEPKPRWHFAMFGFMVVVAIVLAIGSIWIMYNLNYRVMPPMGA